MTTPTPGPFFTPEDVAAMFGLESTNYVRENAAHWPHLRIARQLRFTAEHIEQIASLHEQASATPAASRNQFGRRTRGNSP